MIKKTKKKVGKYRNIKTTIDGIKFDSKVESQFYLFLKKREADGEIKNLELQKTFKLQEAFKYKDYFGRQRTARAITYRADFYYIENNKEFVVDVKGGIITAEFKIKEKLFRKAYKDIIFLIATHENNAWNLK